MNKNKLLVSLALAGAMTFSATTNASTMLGAFIKHDGWSLSDIDKFNTDTSKSMAITTLFSTFDMHWDSLNIQSSNIVSRGAIPMISFMPYSKRHPDMLAAIAAGKDDVYITSWIASFKAWRDSYPEDERPTIMLRFGHEFNGNWYPWGNKPEAFKAAWRHMHSLFEQAGVNDSVEWVWCASATNVDDYNDMTVYYPGADVVDWTGLDGYNWGSNYTWTSWRTFDQVFSSAYVTLVNNFPEKPVILAEVGSAEAADLPDPAWGQNGDDADAGQSKEVWVEDMMQRIMTDYPAIRAISWFNINKELSWALNATAHSGLPNSGLNAYNGQVLNDHFTSSYSITESSLAGEADDVSVQENQTETSTDHSAALTGKKAAIAAKREAKKAALAEKKAKIAAKRAAKKAALAEKKAKKAAKREAKKAALAEKKAKIAAKRAAKKAALAEKKAKKAAKREARKARRAEQQRSLAESRIPSVVGKNLLEHEAEGFRNMPDELLQKIRKSRLNLD